MEKKTIGTFLTALRKANGLTQKQLAEKLNVSDKAVSRWERDECAPDLSLIPVLAEIYGVTSDEILRGQRRDPEAPTRDSDTAKVENQRRRLISNTKMKFRIHSVIAIAIAIVGLIAVSICNFGLYEADIGFMIGCTFYLIAAVCQVIFLILGHAAVSDDDWECDAVKDCKKSMVYLTEWILSGIILLFAFTLPLAGYSHLSLNYESWLNEGIGFILLGALICLIACVFINVKIGYPISPTNRLRLRCGTILALVLAVLLMLQAGLNGFLENNPHLLVSCTKLDTLQAFKEYMETPVDPEGNPMEFLYTIPDQENNDTLYYFQSSTGEYYTLSGNDRTQYLLPNEIPDGVTALPMDSTESESFFAETGYSYQHFNLSVDYINVSDSDTLVPIYTFTWEQSAKFQHICEITNILYLLLYICAIAVTAFIYNKKRKKLP